MRLVMPLIDVMSILTTLNVFTPQLHIGDGLVAVQSIASQVSSSTLQQAREDNSGEYHAHEKSIIGSGCIHYKLMGTFGILIGFHFAYCCRRSSGRGSRDNRCFFGIN